jgi:hypothetical protein
MQTLPTTTSMNIHFTHRDSITSLAYRPYFNLSALRFHSLLFLSFFYHPYCSPCFFHLPYTLNVALPGSTSSWLGFPSHAQPRSIQLFSSVHSLTVAFFHLCRSTPVVLYSSRGLPVQPRGMTCQRPLSQLKWRVHTNPIA